MQEVGYTLYSLTICAGDTQRNKQPFTPLASFNWLIYHACLWTLGGNPCRQKGTNTPLYFPSNTDKKENIEKHHMTTLIMPFSVQSKLLILSYVVCSRVGHTMLQPSICITTSKDTLCLDFPSLVSPDSSCGKCPFSLCCLDADLTCLLWFVYVKLKRLWMTHTQGHSAVCCVCWLKSQ